MKRTPLRKGNKSLKKKSTLKKAANSYNQFIKDTIKLDSDKLFSVYLAIWNTRHHSCGSCRSYLGSEPRTYMFDHLLEKSKYPQFAYDPDNILLVCWDCHSVKTSGHPTKEHRKAMDNFKKKHKI